MIDKIALTIDSCSDNADMSGLVEAIKICHTYLESLQDDDQNIPLAYYFLSNAYSSIRDINKNNGKLSDLDWEDDTRSKELLCLRKSILSDSFYKLDKIRKCQIFTNIANLLDSTGRPVQAIKYWNKAIATDKYFSMAVFNKALGLHSYAKLLFDEGHRFLIFQYVYGMYLLADNHKYLYNIEQFSAKTIIGMASEFCAWWGSKRNEMSVQLGMYHDNIADYDESLGDSAEEILYRKWCLQHTFFINPLNELGQFSLAGHDVCFIPSMTLNKGDGPYLQALYQQMIHEYASSRFVFYQAVQCININHFCMSGVVSIDTFDNPQNGYWLDMIKTSFKMIYGIFDKIGTFIKEYYRIECKISNFRTIWYKDQKIKKGLLDTFGVSKNYALRGLFWLSKDLMIDLEKVDSPQYYLEPMAKEIALLRNRMEHGYVRVVREKNNVSMLNSDFAMIITLEELKNKTHYLFGLVREALMYLSFAVNIEEMSKQDLLKDQVLELKLPIVEN
jgi:tetratricopeptide (TPR) repeat protein